MYQANDSYEPYPPEINVEIEKAYRRKQQNVSWMEPDGRYEVDFVRMVEEKDGGRGAASVVKVKRNSIGVYQYRISTCQQRSQHRHKLLLGC